MCWQLEEKQRKESQDKVLPARPEESLKETAGPKRRENSPGRKVSSFKCHGQKKKGEAGVEATDLSVWSRRQPLYKSFHYGARDARQGEGGGDRCEQGRTNSFPLDLADRRSLHESGFSEKLKAEGGFQPLKKRVSGEGV